MVLAGCASAEEGDPAKPKCIGLEPGVVKNFDDGTTGPGIKTKSGQAVKLSEPLGTKPQVNYAVALAVDTPDGKQVALLTTQELDGGGFTVAVDDTARKLYDFAADLGDDSFVAEWRTIVEGSAAAVAAKECLK